MNNTEERLRCVSCGEVDVPASVPVGPGWAALLLWVSAGVVWAVGFIFAVAWTSYLAAFVFLVAFLYTLWYFFRRERACRHCGARQLQPPTGRP